MNKSMNDSYRVDTDIAGARSQEGQTRTRPKKEEMTPFRQAPPGRTRRGLEWVRHNPWGVVNIFLALATAAALFAGAIIGDKPYTTKDNTLVLYERQGLGLKTDAELQTAGLTRWRGVVTLLDQKTGEAVLEQVYGGPIYGEPTKTLYLAIGKYRECSVANTLEGDYIEVYYDSQGKPQDARRVGDRRCYGVVRVAETGRSKSGELTISDSQQTYVTTSETRLYQATYGPLEGRTMEAEDISPGNMVFVILDEVTAAHGEVTLKIKEIWILG